MDQAKLIAAREVLRARFGASLEESLLEQCAELCRNNNMTGDDLYFKWEAISYNTTPRVFDKNSIQAIKEQLERDAAKTKAQRAQIKGNLAGLLSRNLGSTGKNGARIERNDVLLSKVVNKPQPATMKPDGGNLAGPSTVRITRVTEPFTGSYRYMYEKISDRSEALDDRIDEFAEIVQKHYGISDLGDPGASTEEEVTVVGRITVDFDSASSDAVKLNEAVLTLESSRAMGSGVRVPLRFNANAQVRGAKKGRGGVGLFPGAIVALKGRNGGGGWFLVSEVLTLPPLDAEPLEPGTKPFSASIACGPFTSETDLEYGPWQSALKKMFVEKPDVIILGGPFVDSTHPSLKEGDVDVPPDTLFRRKFLGPLTELLDSLPGAVAILVPSIKDIMSTHVVFPQGELESAFIEDPRIHLLPNPCQFSINGVSFAMSTVDVLFHLRKEEYLLHMSEIEPTAPREHEAPATDNMANLCRHVVEQRSFYPIFPVPQDLLHEVNLDISHSQALTLGGGTDTQASLSVLLLPSKLKHFTKLVGDTTVINPSFISKGAFAMLRFTPDMDEQLVWRCIRAQII